MEAFWTQTETIVAYLVCGKVREAANTIGVFVSAHLIGKWQKLPTKKKTKWCLQNRNASTIVINLLKLSFPLKSAVEENS